MIFISEREGRNECMRQPLLVYFLVLITLFFLSHLVYVQLLGMPAKEGEKRKREKKDERKKEKRRKRREIEPRTQAHMVSPVRERKR